MASRKPNLQWDGHSLLSGDDEVAYIYPCRERDAFCVFIRRGCIFFFRGTLAKAKSEAKRCAQEQMEANACLHELV